MSAQRLSEVAPGRYTYWRDLLAGEKPFGEKKARDTEDKLGLPRGWFDEANASIPAALLLRNENGAMPAGGDLNHEDQPERSLAQGVSLGRLTVPPQLVTRRQLMEGYEPPSIFEIEVEDNAMWPDAPAGSIVRIDRSIPAGPARAVLVRDRASGHTYLRLYEEVDPSHWRAIPTADEPGHRKLDSKEHDLEVLGVVTFVSRPTTGPGWTWRR